MNWLIEVTLRAGMLLMIACFWVMVFAVLFVLVKTIFGF
jgi:hypothetical protein